MKLNFLVVILQAIQAIGWFMPAAWKFNSQTTRSPISLGSCTSKAHDRLCLTNIVPAFFPQFESLISFRPLVKTPTGCGMPFVIDFKLVPEVPVSLSETGSQRLEPRHNESYR